jgi:hypothetical protein
MDDGSLPFPSPEKVPTLSVVRSSRFVITRRLPSLDVCCVDQRYKGGHPNPRRKEPRMAQP